MSSVRLDHWGVALQSGNAGGVVLFDQAVEGLLGLRDDPLASAEAAVTRDEDLVLARILCAYLHLYATSAAGVRRALMVLRPLDSIEASLDERETFHLRAARSWATGQWDDAVRSLERALLHDSHDLLALKVAQDLYFFLGESAELQGVVARVLRAWPGDLDGWGYVQGMLAFGLEENGDYASAEIHARAALHKNPFDTWATHALTHVLEMQGRQREGVAFLNESVEDWSSSLFAVHNWWHKALFYLDLGQSDEVLALYDGPLCGGRSMEWLDIVDAASLLWRLSLFGVDVGDRTVQLAEVIEPLLDDPTCIFNDWHAVMAFSQIGRHEVSQQIAADNRRRALGTNRMMGERAGLALLEGFDAFAAGKYDRAIGLLSEVQAIVNVVGGSHAQRDVVELTVIAATARAGDQVRAGNLVNSRTGRKPGSTVAAAQLLQANRPSITGT